MEKQTTQGTLPLYGDKKEQFLRVLKWTMGACTLIFIATVWLSHSGAKDMSREEKIDAEVAQVRAEIMQIDNDVLTKSIAYKEALKKSQDAQAIVDAQSTVMQTNSDLAAQLRTTRTEKEQRVDALLNERAGLSLSQ